MKWLGAVVVICAVAVIWLNLDLILHRYIRKGDTIILYEGNQPGHRKSLVTKIEGFGKYAAVRMDHHPYAAIRRDVIRKDEKGNWFYRYDD